MIGMQSCTFPPTKHRSTTLEEHKAREKEATRRSGRTKLALEELRRYEEGTVPNTSTITHFSYLNSNDRHKEALNTIQSNHGT